MSGKKVLVAYATRFGSARFVAEDTAGYLTEQGHSVELVDLKKGKPNLPLTDYDFIVAGSSFAMFSWVRRVKRLLRKIKRAGKDCAVYICCGKAIGEASEAEEKWLHKVLDRIGLQARYSLAIEPVIDFRPKEGLDESTKSRIKSLVQSMAGDRYRENELMDLRNPERFRQYLETLGSTIV